MYDSRFDVFMAMKLGIMTQLRMALHWGWRQ